MEPSDSHTSSNESEKLQTYEVKVVVTDTAGNTNEDTITISAEQLATMKLQTK